jgi:hypothetical protein
MVGTRRGRTALGLRLETYTTFSIHSRCVAMLGLPNTARRSSWDQSPDGSSAGRNPLPMAALLSSNRFLVAEAHEQGALRLVLDGGRGLHAVKVRTRGPGMETASFYRAPRSRHLKTLRSSAIGILQTCALFPFGSRS